MVISDAAKPIPCEECGHPTLHVARLVTSDGTLVGQTMVCTACHRHRPDSGPRSAR
jgi:hypothetical protein